VKLSWDSRNSKIVSGKLYIPRRNVAALEDFSFMRLKSACASGSSQAGMTAGG
jgi:hypothetical protein